jgi:hypothetical protein
MRSSCAVRGTRWGSPHNLLHTPYHALHILILTGCLLRCLFGGQQRNELPSLSGPVQAV